MLLGDIKLANIEAKAYYETVVREFWTLINKLSLTLYYILYIIWNLYASAIWWYILF